VLDIACGTGSLLEMADAKGLSCFGSDTSLGMIQQARLKVPRAHFVRADFHSLPFGDDCFDHVVETNAVSAVYADAEKVVAEMLRVCKPRGKVRLADYAKPPTVLWPHRLLAKIGILIGDYPHDYPTIITRLGYQPEVEVLGALSMYQYISASKE
jgi:ubiquinone/menaquinone biosynthesis C-methylase UbiE